MLERRLSVKAEPAEPGRRERERVCGWDTAQSPYMEGRVGPSSGAGPAELGRRVAPLTCRGSMAHTRRASPCTRSLRGRQDGSSSISVSFPRKAGLRSFTGGGVWAEQRKTNTRAALSTSSLLRPPSVRPRCPKPRPNPAQAGS